MRPDEFESFAGASNTKQVANALAESTLCIEQADWNSIEGEDLDRLLEARRTLRELALKYRQNANAGADEKAVEREMAPPVVLADVLRFIWGRNPQAPVGSLSTDQLLEKLVRAYGSDVVAEAVDLASWDVEVPTEEVADGPA